MCVRACFSLCMRHQVEFSIRDLPLHLHTDTNKNTLLHKICKLILIQLGFCPWICTNSNDKAFARQIPSPERQFFFTFDLWKILFTKNSISNSFNSIVKEELAVETCPNRNRIKAKYQRNSQCKKLKQNVKETFFFRTCVYSTPAFISSGWNGACECFVCLFCPLFDFHRPQQLLPVDRWLRCQVIICCVCYK